MYRTFYVSLFLLLSLTYSAFGMQDPFQPNNLRRSDPIEIPGKTVVLLCGNFYRVFEEHDDATDLSQSDKSNQLAHSGSFSTGYFGSFSSNNIDALVVEEKKLSPKIESTVSILQAINDNVINGKYKSVKEWKSILKNNSKTSINVQGQMGFGLLHMAVRCSDSPQKILAFIQLLKDRGIDLSLKSALGETACQMATKSGKDQEIIKALG